MRDATAYALRLAREVLATQRKRVLWVMVLTLFNGVAQGATVLLLVPLLRVAGVPVGPDGTVGGIDRFVSGVFAALRLPATLPVVLLAFVVLAWAQAMLGRLELVESARLEQGVVYDLRVALYAVMLAARWSFFTHRRGSDLAHAITRDADRAAAAVSYLLRAASQGVAAFVYLCVAVAISPLASLVALTGGALLTVLLRGTFRSAHDTGEEMSDASTDTLAVVTQHVEGIKLVKSFGAERSTLAAFEALAARSARADVDAMRAHAGAHVATAAGAAALLAVSLYVALHWLRVPAAATLMLAFLFWRLLPRLLDVQQSLRDAVHELPGYEIAHRLRDACAAAREADTSRDRVAAPPMVVRQAIQFEHVTFRYDGGSPVLRDASCVIRAGAITGLAGPSGAGKTTLVDLVLGLLSPSAGRITIDGEPLTAELLAGWRDVVAYVPQEPLLFHDTVIANLRWARPDATPDEVQHALTQAAAADFVAQLPHGLHTVVGDRGVRLSGGERQRLALARALLRRPTILVLDEITSALDVESESHILAAIAALRGTVTTLLVSHRAAPLRHADIVYALDGGTIRVQVSDAV